MSCNSLARKLIAQAAGGNPVVAAALQDAYEAPPFVRPDEDEGQLRREAQALLLRVKAHAAAQGTSLTVPEHLNPASPRSRSFVRWGRLGLALHGTGTPHPDVSLASFPKPQQQTIMGAEANQLVQFACEAAGSRQLWLAKLAAQELGTASQSFSTDIRRCAAVASSAFRGTPGMVAILNDDPREKNDPWMALHRYGTAIQVVMLADTGALPPNKSVTNAPDMDELQRIRSLVPHVRRDWTRSGDEAAMNIAAAAIAFARQVARRPRRRGEDETADFDRHAINEMTDYAIQSGAWGTALSLLPQNEPLGVQASSIQELSICAPDALLPEIEVLARRVGMSKADPWFPASSLQANALSGLVWRYQDERRDALIREIMARCEADPPPGNMVASALTQIGPLLTPEQQQQAIRLLCAHIPAPRYGLTAAEVTAAEVASRQANELTKLAYRFQGPARLQAAMAALERVEALPTRSTTELYINSGVVVLSRLYPILPPEVRSPHFATIMDFIDGSRNSTESYSILCAMLAGTDGEEREAVLAVVNQQNESTRNDILRSMARELPAVIFSSVITSQWGDYATAT